MQICLLGELFSSFFFKTVYNVSNTSGKTVKKRTVRLQVRVNLYLKSVDVITLFLLLSTNVGTITL